MKQTNNIKKLIVFIALLLLITLTFSSCTTKSIKDIKNNEYVDKQVKVKGTVFGTMKLGPISGYTLTDKNEDSIKVSSNKLPSDGDTITVKGTLRKSPLLGYYIEVDD